MTIIFATHIFDGLDTWASKLLYMKPNGNLELSTLNAKPIYPLVKSLLKNYLPDKKEMEEKNNDYTIKSTDGAGGFAPGRFYNYWG